jgi:hypothetical protein
MDFSINKSIEILERTPDVLRLWLTGLSAEWIAANEGEDTWSPYDIIGHFIHGEKTDWIVRAQLILSHHVDKTFVPFDRFAQFENSKGKSIDDLLNEFKMLRSRNIVVLKSLHIDENKQNEKGIHPDFGEVSLEQLLSAWVVHDLNHISQIARVMAKQYTVEVGPWIEYLRILRQ